MGNDEELNEMLRKGKVRQRLKGKLEDRDYKILKSAMNKMPILRKLVTTLLKPEVLSPKDFYDAFMRDIIDAEGEITIYSPFTLKPKVQEILAFIKRSKAHVTVFTKPVDEFKDRQKYYQGVNIGLMEEAGVEVKTREKMHEKAVLIGDNIAYFGSLNVLSRWKEEAGGDYMLRYESPLVSSLIDDFLKEVDGKLRDAI